MAQQPLKAEKALGVPGIGLGHLRLPVAVWPPARLASRGPSPSRSRLHGGPFSAFA